MEKPVTLTARNPADLLAAVPCVLGFRPEDSVVLLTFGPPGSSFHARVDLPRTDEDVAEVSTLLREAARRNAVTRLALVGYSESPDAGDVLVRLAADFVADGCEVIDVLRAGADRWFPVLPGRPARHSGVPYDPAVHPFAAQSVLAGRVTHDSREELAATLTADAAGTERVASCVAELRRRPSAQVQRAAEAAWVRATVSRHVRRREPFSDRDAARLLLAIGDVGVRDVAWSTMTGENAHDQADLWRDVVRRSPIAVLAPAATLLAFAAWLAGQGALAWCALDRCAEADAGYNMARLVAQMLTGAMPPSTWEPFGDELLHALRDPGSFDPGGPAA